MEKSFDTYFIIMTSLIFISTLGIAVETFEHEELTVDFEDKDQPTKWQKFLSEKISFHNYLPPLR